MIRRRVGSPLSCVSFPLSSLPILSFFLALSQFLSFSLSFCFLSSSISLFLKLFYFLPLSLFTLQIERIRREAS
ncbi:hypothetical protein CSUI_004631 [Cystoisospora suis]|uniref:Transmembrane protein n=1 Tax=Cystoisospora suis TaxID=483139 RepID=A0A2C6L086_9APIC|nr:hypothetical protein CSUI_004631 [Cystoisospora suis]